MERIVDTTNEWILQRTGIQERRIFSENETVLDMAVHAARKAIADAGLQPADIGDIRVAVNTWMRFPSLATQVQAALGIVDSSASDVAAGCAGFVYAVEDAYNKLSMERDRYGRELRALVIGVDGLSLITDGTDRNTCVLLGAGVRLENIGYVFPHQANYRIIAAVADSLGVSLDRVYTDGIRKYGNTSAASIPIGWDECRDQARGKLIVDVAFGAGFASGAVLRRG